ncbi:MAG TPA: hypothetical protein VMI52_03915 [Acetobacteraceae bacterium]|nr:hypothetical protein [Acetobacteraceae bacterium]
MRVTNLRLLSLAGFLFAAFLASPRTAEAVPSFAARTGQPCSSCHIGAFGPQLTPFGRAFKIGGYTLQGGDGIASKIPLSAMVLGSFNNTQADYPDGTVPRDFKANNNFALDQVSVFLAGRATDWAGGFAQGTYSGIDRAYYLDNVDLRPYTTTFDMKDADLRVGITVNNNPTVQDPFNTTFAWGYPYVLSGIAPQQAAQPVLAGGFSGNSVGVTAYAWYDSSLYFEAGAYSTLDGDALSHLGTFYGPGSTRSLSPYVRGAYEWNWNAQSAHVGALFMHAGADPVVSGRTTDGSNGSDSYTDYAIDGGYQFFGEGTHTISLDGIYVHEDRKLNGTTTAFNLGNGTQYGPNANLDQLRLTASYWYQNTYGLTVAWQDTWGTSTPALYMPGPVTGSANGKPDTNDFTFEADWVPFGKQDSWGAPFANLKLGIQYVVYTKFNGGGQNYDGFGRNAADNNTLYTFA